MDPFCPITTSYNIYAVSSEAQHVFDVFIPENQATWKNRVFAFIHFKMEWDANKALEKLNLDMIGDKSIH